MLQGLCDFGAERIVVAGLPPIGCLPIIITLNAKDGIHDRSCIEPHNAIAYDYNRKLQALLQDYSTSRRVHVIYADIYNPLLDLVLFPTKHGKQLYVSLLVIKMSYAQVLHKNNQFIRFRGLKRRLLRNRTDRSILLVQPQVSCVPQRIQVCVLGFHPSNREDLSLHVQQSPNCD